MDNAFGNDDDLRWEGLACPPLDEYAFHDFDVACNYDIDGILDDPLLQGDEEEDAHHLINHTNEVVGVDKKTKICYGNNGKGKQLNVAEIKDFLGDETEDVAEQNFKKRKILDCYDCQSQQQKERWLDHANRRLDCKGIADFDVKLESPKPNVGNALQGKYMVRPNQTDQLGVLDKKRKAVTDFRLKDKSSESACEPRRRENLMMLDKSNQPGVTDNKLHADYNSRYEATRNKLHELYGQIAEAKQQRRIQVIDFQRPVMEQPRCRAKAKGKTCLRQKLMAMGTHKSKKKFQPLVY